MARNTKQSKENDGKEAAKKLFLQGHTVTEIAIITGASRQSIYRWSKEENWDEEKERFNSRNAKLLATVSELQGLTEDQKDIKISELAKDQLILTLVAMRELTLENPNGSIMLSETLKKTLTSLEKLVNAKVKAETKGEKNVNVNVQTVDWTQIYRMMIDAKKQGKIITKEEAFNLVKAAKQNIKDVSEIKDED